MDPKTFYGIRNVHILDWDKSEDENLSDDDNYRREMWEFGEVLAEESDSLSEENDAEGSNECIPETDLEDQWDEGDLIPLSQLQNQRKSNKATKKKKQNKEQLKWLDDLLNVPDEEIAFKDFQPLPADILELEDPIQFFFYFFTKDILSHITEQANLYSVQIRPEKPANISEDEIKAFVGICIYMSMIHLPSTRSYWNNSFEIPTISQTMTCNRFEEIKRFIHFSNNEEQVRFGEPGYDKLFKIRPFLDKLRKRLLLIPKEEHLAVDEQIIPTKARSSLKQYNPKKPHKWGFKVFVLSGISGFSYDFDFYCGSTNLQNQQPDFGASSNVVVKLADTIPRNKNYKIFFDNWFSSIPLLVFLTKEGILPLGTVRKDRVGNCKFPSDREMKSRGRGSFVEKVTEIDGIKVSLVAWYDNKLVTTVSTYVGSQPLSEARRFDRKQKSHILIPRPKCIEVYNNYMGGVDLLDSMLGYYRIQIRSKKWYMRVFFHFIDMICVNSWILFRRKHQDSDFYLPLSEFKLGIAEVLTKSTLSRKRGRPSNNSLQPQLDLKKKKYPFAQIPTPQIRTDTINHLPQWDSDRQRCKFPDCSGKSFVFCEKCKVHLCLNKERNCFRLFHTE